MSVTFTSEVPFQGKFFNGAFARNSGARTYHVKHFYANGEQPKSQMQLEEMSEELNSIVKELQKLNEGRQQ